MASFADNWSASQTKCDIFSKFVVTIATYFRKGSICVFQIFAP